MSIFQSLFGWAQHRHEEVEIISNPIKAKIGQQLNIDVLDYRKSIIVISGIRELSLDGDVVDYDLLITGIDKKESVGKLRIISDVKRESGFRALILHQYDKLPFDQGLYGVLSNPKQGMVVTDEKIGLHEEFFRVRSSPSFFSTEVTTLVDKNKDGKVTMNEVTKEKSQCWDYTKNDVVEGVAVVQYLYVEMDSSRGFTLWKGVEVDTEDIQTI